MGNIRYNRMYGPVVPDFSAVFDAFDTSCEVSRILHTAQKQIRFLYYTFIVTNLKNLEEFPKHGLIDKIWGNTVLEMI